MISKLTRSKGVLKIDIDGTLYEPLSFKSFRPTARNISDFAKAGVKLFSILSSGLYSILGVPYSLYGESWLGKGQYDFTAIDRQIELFRENAPGCYFALMFQLDTREWWLKSHENYPNSFTHLSQMASDPEWREAAADYMQSVLRHVEEKYGDIMYGYFLMCGTTTEWFSDRDYEASHPLKESFFKDYTGDPAVEIPSVDQLLLSEDLSFNPDPTVKRYRKFHAEQTADTILYFAAKAQEVLQHKKLLGLYFGYLFELAHARLWDAGHLAYEKVFFSEDINMISSPSSYGYRDVTSTSNFMVTYKTLDMHDKLYYLEFDHITHLAPSHIEGFLIPGGDDKCKDQTETLNLMQRDFMLCAANGAALWWFDMFEGWFYSEEMMSCIRDMIGTARRLSEYPQESAAEIAVIASGDTLYGVNKTAHVNDKLLGAQRDGLARMGAPYDMYTAGDLKNIDIDRYKLFIFLDAFEITAEQARVITSLKTAGKTILWMYAPGYLENDLSSPAHGSENHPENGLKAMQELTGIQLEEMAVPAKSLTFRGLVMSQPQFAVCDPEAISLGEYDSGKCALAYKKLDDCTSVYSGAGNLGGDVLRGIAELAGVHIYSRNAPVYVNSCLTGVYALQDTELYMKEDGIYEDVFTGKKYQTTNGVLTVPADDLHAKLFMKANA